MRLREAWVSSRRRIETVSIPDASLEAEVLLRHALRIDRATFFASLADELSDGDAGDFERFVERRIGGEPLAYITGHREFYGLDFAVTPDVLIPRQETELLVEAVLQHAKGRLTPSPHQAGHSTSLTPSSLEGEGRGEGESVLAARAVVGAGPLAIADIGTGSGAIAVSLACQLPDAIVYATDVSPNALRVADTNRRRHGVEDRVHFRQSDMLEALDGPVDVIVSNPPYLNADEMADLPPDVRHEPMIALGAGVDGLDVLLRLFEEAPSYLNPGGLLVVEIDPRRLDAVMDFAHQAFADAEISLTRDHADLARMVSVALPQP